MNTNSPVDSILDDLCATFNLDRHSVNLDARIVDLGGSSLSFTLLAAKFDARHDHQLSPLELLTLFECESVRDVVRFLESLTQSKDGMAI